MIDQIHPLTGFGDDINSSIKFSLLMERNSVPAWSGGPRLAQLVIPNGPRTVTQNRGRNPWEITLRCEFASIEDLELLDMVQGQRATLRYAWGLTKRVLGTVSNGYLILPDTLLLGMANETIAVDGVCEADATFQRSAEVPT